MFAGGVTYGADDEPKGIKAIWKYVEKHPIWNKVVAGVIGGVILATILGIAKVFF